MKVDYCVYVIKIRWDNSKAEVVIEKSFLECLGFLVAS